MLKRTSRPFYGKLNAKLEKIAAQEPDATAAARIVAQSEAMIARRRQAHAMREMQSIIARAEAFEKSKLLVS